MAQTRVAVTTGNVQSAQIVVDMANKVFHLEPSSDPLCVFMDKMGRTRTVENPEFKHLEQELVARTTQINNSGGYDDNDTALVVDDASIFFKWDTAEVESTGEVLLITNVDVNTNTLTVTRAWGGTAASMADNAVLRRIAPAFTEYSAMGEINIRPRTAHTSWTQIYRRAYGVGNTLRQTKLYGGNELTNLRTEQGIEYAVDIEHSYLFQKASTASGNTPRRSFNGLIPSITSLTYNAAGTLTEANFEINFLESLFRYGSKTKLFLCSARFLSAMDFWGRQKLQILDQMSTKLGVQVSQYVSGHGTLLVAKHNLLTGAKYGGYGVAVDLKNVCRVVLSGRDTKVLTNRQGNDIDGVIEEFLSEQAIEVNNQQTMGYVYGCTGGA